MCGVGQLWPDAQLFLPSGFWTQYHSALGSLERAVQYNHFLLQLVWRTEPFQTLHLQRQPSRTASAVNYIHSEQIGLFRVRSLTAESVSLTLILPRLSFHRDTADVMATVAAAAMPPNANELHEVRDTLSVTWRRWVTQTHTKKEKKQKFNRWRGNNRRAGQEKKNTSEETWKRLIYWYGKSKRAVPNQTCAARSTHSECV